MGSQSNCPTPDPSGAPLNPWGWTQPGLPGARYLGMDRPILTKDTGAAIGLITGIILGSLLLDLTGWY
jgi:hypothetical protein